MNFCVIVFLVLIVFLAASVLFYRNTWTSSEARKLNEFPGPKLILPFLGNFVNLFLLDGGMPYNYNLRIRKYGKNIRFWVFQRPYLLTTDLEVIDKVLSSNIHTEKSHEYRSSFFFLGKGILTSAGQVWKRERKLIAPTFGKEMTETFSKLVNKNSTILMHTLKKEFGETPEIEKDIRITLGRCTGDIMIEFICDDNLNLQESSKNLKYVDAMVTVVDSLAKRVNRPWIVLPIIRTLNGLHEEQAEAMKAIHQAFPKEMLKKSIQKWRPIGEDMARGKDTLEHPRKAIHVLAAAGLPERHLFYQMVNILGAGADTTMSAISGICFLLASNPVVQQKVRDEVYNVIGEYHFTKEITKDHLKEMKYLECAIKESLRIFTPGPTFGRQIAADITLKNGKVIPKGTNVMILAAQVHTDPENYPCPHKFIPERFLPVNSIGRPQYSFIPFSSGPRNCLGQHLGMVELKIFIARILLWFELHTTMRMEDVEWQGIIASAKGGLPLSLKKIN